MLRTAMAARCLVRPTQFWLSVSGFPGQRQCIHNAVLFCLAVKRAKQVRRCAQVLLDCRWFAKRFSDQRIEMLEDEEQHVRVVSTLAAHLKLQVCTLENVYHTFCVACKACTLILKFSLIQ